MKYIYVGRGAYIPGLPARDIDDAELSEAQRALLPEAVASGVYKAEEPAAPPKKSSKPSDE